MTTLFAQVHRGLVLALVCAVLARAATPPVPASPRERLRLDADWRFALGHATDPARDFDFGTAYFTDLAKAGYGDGPAAAKFDDRAWRQLDLPHDWAVEAPFDPKASASHGYKAIGRGFPERSIGWYRKHLEIAQADLGRRIVIKFDGVYRDAQVWVNGFFLGRQPSGYLGARYDLSDYLHYGGDNVISVRVDATQEEGWYYEGAGIYRHVWLVKTDPLHVAAEGTFVTSEVHEESATVTAKITVANESADAASFEMAQDIVDADGHSVASANQPALAVPAGQSAGFTTSLSVGTPQLWSVEHPNLYTLVTTIRRAGVIVDSCRTSFGIRTLRWDHDTGFWLNGQRVELKGTNNHQDHAGVGVALPDGLQTYRLARLKELGVNAYRCSHHPPTPELLEACDRLGLLVIDEHRVMGSNPAQLGQLEAMIRRDRNHPSVILWSLGNEEWAIEGNETGARIARTMQASARSLDPTRLTAIASSGGWGRGVSTVAQVMGFNYLAHGNIDRQHADFPWQAFVGTEETSMQETRGSHFRDPARAHQGPQANGNSGGNLIKGWQFYAQRPFLAGVFFWTGFDYRGETTPFEYPAISSQFGILDTCGFPKDSAWYLRAWWRDEPVLHLFPHWNWAGHEGQEIVVGCYSNHEEVELLVNGHSLGRQAMPRNGELSWKVTYAPGTLEARGYRGGKVVATEQIETTGASSALVLTPDRPQVASSADDVVIFTVAAKDSAGRLVPDAANLVTFAVTGGKILGVGNGDPGCLEPDTFPANVRAIPVVAWRGRIAPGTAREASDPIAFEPLSRLGNWLAPKPQPGEVYDLAATLTRGEIPPGTTLTLFLPSLGTKTSVWLNGREIAHDVDTTQAGPALPLDVAQLMAGENRVQLLVTPFADGRNHIPELDRIGALQIATAAPAAQRSLFNGLAQVIIQAPRSAGEIRLRAFADGLVPAEVTVPAR